MASLDLRALSCGAVAFAGPALLMAGAGGFEPPAWGWAGLAAAWIATLAVVLWRGGPRGRLEQLFAGLFVLSGLWALLSSVWSLSPPSSILEAQRLLVVTAGVLAALSACRSADAPLLRLGLLGAISATCVANLVHRAGGYEATTGAEAEPVGYANGLAILAALGILLALELGRTNRIALFTLPVTGAVLVLAESTGAWFALVIGFAVAAIVAAGRTRVAGAAVLVAGLAAAALSFEGHQRELYWGVAWGAVEERPLLGAGAGTFAQLWVLERDTDASARDAHSLYLETLAEQGPLGLGLLVAALGVPLVAARRRPRPLLLGAYAAFLAHVGIDWDWELTAIALAGVLLGASFVLESREEGARVRARPLWAGVALVLVVASAVTLAGALSLERARDSLREGRTEDARERARQATRLAPWSTDAALVEAEARLALGDGPGARATAREALELDAREWRLWALLARASDGAERERALARARSLNPLGGL